MEVFPIALLITTLLCSLVAGLLFTFAVVVMPGIARLDDREFIRAFQVIDGVIQDNQPLFMLVWLGSVVALLLTAGLGFGRLDDAGRLLLGSGLLGYLLGVQAPTIAINVPLNNRLQQLQPDGMDEAARREARTAFESRWNRWNVIRTWVACLSSVALLTLLARL